MNRIAPLRIRTQSADIFFNGNRIVRSVQRANRSALMRAGAFIRRRARSSIRKRKSVSDPGKPPSSHTGRLRGLILFGYDRAAQTVVVGPKATGGRDQAGETLEHGKVVTRRERRRRRRMRYRARPFMGPALEKETEAGSFPKLWANAVKA